MVRKWANTNLGATAHNEQDNASMRMSLQNHVRTLIDRATTYGTDKKDLWGEAYIDSDGRNNSVNTSNTSAVFDTNKYKFLVPSVYVVIKGTITNTAPFFVNNCKIVLISTGLYVVYCVTGTDNVKRAQIIKTLFYGTDGSDAALSPANFTTITSIETSTAADVGKQAVLAKLSGTLSYPGSMTYTGTFADTTTNTNCNSWSYCLGKDVGVSVRASWNNPAATQLNTSITGTISDETGTDTTADDKSNPATCTLTFGTTNTTASPTTGNIVRAIILTKGSISWVYSETGSATDEVYSNVDYTSVGVPTFTAATPSEIASFAVTIEQAIPSGTFSPTCSSAIIKALVANIETGATITHELTNASESSGTIPDGETFNFTAFTSEPTKIITTLTPKSSSPTAGYPAIYGIGAYVE